MNTAKTPSAASHFLNQEEGRLSAVRKMSTTRTQAAFKQFLLTVSRKAATIFKTDFISRIFIVGKMQ